MVSATEEELNAVLVDGKSELIIPLGAVLHQDVFPLRIGFPLQAS